ncbi:hypothetical protein [Frankia sp. ArI3]|uniref:hypothetical protein n=1 Tax=Frankia sp. ArI3 TaxID=1858 RepID=UPI001C6FCE4A|nr:hypothetical protein [Frankia sp. ArI3]
MPTITGGPGDERRQGGRRQDRRGDGDTEREVHRAVARRDRRLRLRLRLRRLDIGVGEQGHDHGMSREDGEQRRDHGRGLRQRLVKALHRAHRRAVGIARPGTLREDDLPRQPKLG